MTDFREAFLATHFEQLRKVHLNRVIGILKDLKNLHAALMAFLFNLGSLVSL